MLMFGRIVLSICRNLEIHFSGGVLSLTLVHVWKQYGVYQMLEILFFVWSLNLLVDIFLVVSI